MAVFAVHIKKSVLYRGEERPFGNTYHFKTADLQTFNDLAVAEQLREAERPVTSSAVTFTGWSTWGPTDTINPVDTVMRDQGEWTFAGLGNNDPALYAENCALVVWPLPRSPVHNRRRWMRKFIRMPGFPVGLIANGVLRGADPLDPGHQNSLLDYAVAVQNTMSMGSGVELCTADGTERNGPAEVRPYLLTRDIGR